MIQDWIIGKNGRPFKAKKWPGSIPKPRGTAQETGFKSKFRPRYHLYWSFIFRMTSL
jgi:hypothetical protein